MKKQIILPAFALLALPAAAQNVVIKGTFSGDTKGYDKVYIYGNGVKQDSVEMTDGQFEFTLPFEKTFMPLFYTEYDKSVKHMYAPYPVLIEGPGTVTLSGGDITKGMGSFEVSGMQSAIDYSVLREKQNTVYRAVNDKIAEKHGEKWFQSKDKNIMAERQLLINAQMSGVLEEFIKAHPDSYVSGLALSMARSSVKAEELERLYDLLSPKGKQMEEAQNIAAHLKGLKASAIGSTVQDFTLNTPEEKPLSFSDLKGKYVLIDFWASWCGPCKQSFPHMKEVYKKYKGDKFEIYSISIDKDKDAWLKGLKEQDLPWLQTLDTKDISKSGFAVTGVPTTFLIDPQGKILMKEVGFDPGGNSPLEKKLAELFDK